MTVITKTPEARFVGRSEGFFKINKNSERHTFELMLKDLRLFPFSAEEILPILTNVRNLAGLFGSENGTNVKFYLKDAKTLFKEGYGKRIITINKSGEMSLHLPESTQAADALRKLEPTRRIDMTISVHPGDWQPMLTVLNSNEANRLGFRFLLYGDYGAEIANALVGKMAPEEFHRTLLKGLYRD